MRTRAILAAAAASLLPVAGRGVDAPHTAATIPNATGCSDCHMLHNAPGGSLTNRPDSFTVCTHCHNSLGAAFSFGGAWYTSHQATPNAGGRSHHATGSTTSAAYGATPPTHPALQRYTADGQLKCSSCHDPHVAGSSGAPGNLHVSVATGTALARTGGTGSGNAQMTLTVGSGALAKGYRIRIGPGTSQFQVSHDARSQQPSLVTWGTPYAFSANTPVPLTHAEDDPAVSVRFSAVPAVAGDYWDFYVGFPFLRMAIGEGELCLACHPARAQAHGDVETSATYGWATGQPFSHPVGEGLNANGKGYDVATPLGVNGAPQGPASSSSDLRLSPTGMVTCLSCHAAHNADSNSQTPDAR